MGKFNYTVQDSRGETVSGILEAVDENEAIGALQGKGYFILSIQMDKQESRGGISQFMSGSGRVGQRTLAFFGEQLSTLLNGGVPLVRALSLLGEHSESKGLQTAVTAVTKDVAGGASLHKAMEKYPNIFDGLWVALVQAGEMGGQLPKTLKQVSRYVHSQEEAKGKVISAMMYPVILGTVAFGVLAFFIIKIVPTFSDIFQQFHLKLPVLTRVIIAISAAVVGNLVLFLVLSVVISIVLYGFLQTEAGQQTKAEFLLGIPLFGNFFRSVYTERLLTTLSTLVESGVSILNALVVLEGVFSSNLVFLRALRKVKNEVATGKSISSSFREAKILPGMVSEMMLMGEESGKLPEILSTLSDFYKEQVDQFVRRFTALIEPMMVIVVGAIVAVIVVSIFLPIFQLSQIGTRGG